MDKQQLQTILDKHLKWLNGENGGEQADLQGANLQGADLRGTNLRGTNLRWADLRWANLRWANLQGADLEGANLQGADLQGANLDFSCLPLWCGSFNIKADRRLFAQLLCHITRLDVSEGDEDVKTVMQQLRAMPASDWFCEYRNDVKPLQEGL